MKLTKESVLVLLVASIILGGFGAGVMAQSGDLIVYVNVSSTDIVVGDTVQFNVNVSEGIAPYAYEWDFDDVDTYKNPTNSQNPSHTFNWAGKHYVEVKVTDSASNTGKVLLVINVEIDNLMPTVNAVSDCGCDNSGAANCAGALVTCINDNYDGAHGLRIEFPSGTYRFDAFDYNDRMSGIYISTHTTDKKISMVGIGDIRPVLRFYNPSTEQSNSGNTWDAFIIFPGIANPVAYLHLRNIIFEEDGTSGDHWISQVFMGGVDGQGHEKYVTVEDCDIRKFSCVGNYVNTLLKRNNIIGCGTFGSGATEHIRFAKNCLCTKSYIVNGDTGGLENGHSHIWYFTGSSETYVIDNYADLSNAAHGRNGGQLKMAVHNTTVSGNIIKNAPSAGLTLGGYDGQAYDVEYSYNRIINSETGIRLASSSGNISFSNNFFKNIDYHVFSLADGSKCVAGLNVSGVIIQDNILGYMAPDGSHSAYECHYEDCIPQRTCDVAWIDNTDNDSMYNIGDPAGWYNGSDYLDPTEFEFTPPTTNSFQINNGNATTSSTKVTLSTDVTDSGSGMGISARFPFTQGALMMFSNDDVNWYQVEDYATTHTWTLTGGDGAKTVYVRFRDRDGNWGDVVSDTITLVEDHKADLNDDGVIDLPELMAFIARWKTGDGVSRAEVLEARDIWFAGGVY